MRKLILALPLVLGACSTSSVTPGTVCASIAKVAADPVVGAQLATLNPQSALGQLWAYANSGCAGAVAVGGVNPSWTQLVWSEFQQLAPTIIPLIAGLL
jgi:hypothetical protein